MTNHNITISSAKYPSPFTITHYGGVNGNGGPSAAVNMVTPGASLQNSGGINGQGGYGSRAAQVGLSASGGTIVNYGYIRGGYGQVDGNGFSGKGGDGVDLGAGSMLTNANNFSYFFPGYIVGGGVLGGSGAGGIGVSIAAGATLSNTGHIKSGFASGDGGAGVYLSAGGTLINAGPANGQYGRGWILGGASGHGAGGVGVILAAGASFTNGNIIGNIGSHGGAFIKGGLSYSASHAGGAGVYLHAGAGLTNDSDGVIQGGQWSDAPVASSHYNSAGGDGVDLAANAHAINYGAIYGGNELGTYTGGIGVSLAAGATLTNTAIGHITGGGGYQFDSSGNSVTDGGTGGAGAYVGSNAVLVNLGQGTYSTHGVSRPSPFGINGGAALVGGAGVVLNGGTFINAGLVVGGYNGRFGGTGNNRADAVRFGSKAGTLEVESGFQFIGNVVAVSGVADVLEVSGSSSTALSGIGTQFQNFEDITFAGGAAWTISGNTTGLAANHGVTISGFAHADTIDLTGFAATSKTYVAGTGLVLSDGSQSVTLDIAGSFTTSDFSIAGDGTGGTLIEDTACYCPGTLIRTRRGQKNVEELQIGDEVMTAAGVARPVKWIGRRSYGGRFVMGRRDILPVCIKAGALDDNVPQRDLWISPHHAMYFAGDSTVAGTLESSLRGAKRRSNPGRSHQTGLLRSARNDGSGNGIQAGVLIEAKDLINGVSIVQAERVETVEYVHVELDSHDVIIAEGALSESFVDDDSRGMFHNAQEYGALYPEAARAKAQYCAPRPDQGYEVEAARRRIALRAGLRAADECLGPLRGYVDVVGADRIAGWAQSVDHPEAPVCVDIFAGGRLIGQTVANQYREDLEQAKLGSGRHSFAFTPPAGLAFAPDGVEVRRSLDGAALELSAATRRPTTSGDQPKPRCAAPAPSHPQIKVHRRA
jgi:hypothetical protein